MTTQEFVRCITGGAARERGKRLADAITRPTRRPARKETAPLTLERAERFVELCERLGVRPSKVLRRACNVVQTAGEMHEFLMEEKDRQSGRRVRPGRRTGPVTDAASFVRAITR